MARMKILTLGLLALGALPPAAATPDLRPELEPVGVVERLHWTPAGDLWFGTEDGQVYVSRDGGRSWAEVPVSPLRPRHSQDYERIVDGDVIRHIPFFDAKRGLALGYMRDRKDSGYRTTDGGATWKPIQLQRNMLATDAQVTPEGRAWVVGFSGEILTSEDYGATWRRLELISEEDTSLESVYFTSPAIGVVSADGIYLTRDGGGSWRNLPVPFSQGLLSDCHNKSVEKIRVWAGRLFAQQCRSWFAGALPETEGEAAGTIAWQPLRVEGKRLLELEPVGDRLLAILEDREIVFLDSALQIAARSGFTLPSPPIHVTVSGSRIAILDRERRVTVGENGSFSWFPMLGQGGQGDQETPGSSRVYAFDRAADGTLWGISPFFLYRSRDAGRTWERQAALPQGMNGLALRPGGEVFLWNRQGYKASYDPRTGAFDAVPGLDKLDVVGLFRRNDLWLVYGGLQEETTGRVEAILRVWARDQFDGSAPHGFVAVSTDGGGRWQVVDRWEDAGPQALFLAEDNTLTLLSWLGSVRRGKLSIDEQGWVSAELSTVFRATGTWSDPFAQEAWWLDFLDGDEGWVIGFIDHVGTFLYHSRDGGRSWVLSTEGQKRAVGSLNRLGSGVWLAVDEKGLVRWEDHGFRPDKRFAVSIRKAWTDSTGGLLVTLVNDELWRLDAGGSSWTRLR